MSYIIFNVAVSFAYLVGMMALARELRASTKAERRENQSVPLFIFCNSLLCRGHKQNISVGTANRLYIG